MTSGRREGNHNKNIAVGMTNLQEMFQDKTNILKGLTKEEIISLYYKIPIRKVKDMKKDTLDSKWSEIAYVKKNLIKSKLCAIDYKKIERNVPITNEEFGVREFDIKKNIFFKISNISDADDVGDKYNKLAKAFHNKAEDIHEIGEETQQQIPILEKIAIR